MDPPMHGMSSVKSGSSFILVGGVDRSAGQVTSPIIQTFDVDTNTFTEVETSASLDSGKSYVSPILVDASGKTCP